jgi:hypothetical protein
MLPLVAKKLECAGSRGGYSELLLLRLHDQARPHARCAACSTQARQYRWSAGTYNPLSSARCVMCTHARARIRGATRPFAMRATSKPTPYTLSFRRRPLNPNRKLLNPSAAKP